MAKARKRNNSYQLIAYCGYKSDGTQNRRYRTWKPFSDMTEKQAEKEAQRQAKLFEEECKRSEIISSSMTLTAFCAMYLEIKKDVLAERTYNYYVSVINGTIIPSLGSLKLDEIKTAHIQSYINILKKTDISPSTIKRKLSVLQSIMKQAENLDLIEVSPVKINKLTMPKITKPKTEIFTKQEMAKILELLEKEPVQFRLAIHLAIMTGARRGEIAALKYSDFDYDNCTVNISRSAYKLTGQPVKVKAPKDNENRTVAITPYCLHLIRMLRLMNGAGDNDFVFTENGNLINPQRISERFFKFLKDNGFRHRKFHALRHTSATLMLYGGVNINQVRNRLGHGSLKTTQIYIHCVPEADSEAVGVLQSLIFKKIPTCSDYEEESTHKTG